MEPHMTHPVQQPLSNRRKNSCCTCCCAHDQKCRNKSSTRNGKARAKRSLKRFTALRALARRVIALLVYRVVLSLFDWVDPIGPVDTSNDRTSVPHCRVSLVLSQWSSAGRYLKHGFASGSDCSVQALEIRAAVDGAPESSGP